MTADLEIFTARVEHALFVPQRAVVREDMDTFVRIVENGELVRVPVTTGIRSTDGMIEITFGLTEGQEIINFIRE
jgi:multidrug efflux pump subunit AcrA (membrane-fusion protein)